MLRTLEAMIDEPMIDEQGDIRLLEHIRLPKNCRVLVTILEEVPLLFRRSTTLGLAYCCSKQ
jgi:hypothetical protein